MIRLSLTFNSFLHCTETLASRPSSVHPGAFFPGPPLLKIFRKRMNLTPISPASAHWLDFLVYAAGTGTDGMGSVADPAELCRITVVRADYVSLDLRSLDYVS